MLRILVLSNRIPYPPKDGGAIAVLNMVYGFIREGHHVKLLSLNTNKHYIALDNVPKGLLVDAQLEAIPINTNIKPLAALTNLLFSRASYNVSRFYSKEFEDKLIQILKENKFDIIQLEGLHISVYLKTIRSYSNAIIGLRAHNVEHIIWDRLAAAERAPIKKQYLNILTKRLKKYELDIINRFDTIIAITEEDAQYFKNNGCKMPIHVSPTGLAVSEYKISKQKPERGSLFHLGALDWMPNQQAIQWFLEEIWPKVLSVKSEAKFYIAGRNLPDWIKTIKIPGVVVEGEIPSAADFINSKEIMVVPLLSGSGMRIKIVEGLALGKCIISTSIGAEGIACTQDKNILIADTAEQFAQKIINCLDDESLVHTIGKNARLLAEQDYDNDKITAQLTKFYTKILEAKN